MRHRRSFNRQQTRHSVRVLIHEIVERAAVVEDIKSLYVSLLSQAQDLLHLGEDGCVDDKMMKGFLLRVRTILDDVRTSIRELGCGDEERRLLRQADQVEEIVGRITDVCLNDGLLAERWK